MSFLASYPKPNYTSEVAQDVVQDLQLLEGSELLEPHTLRRILEKVRAWQGVAFTLDPEALHGWEARFAELGYSAP